MVKGHGDGLNGLWGDGSVHWLPRSTVQPYVKTITAAFAPGNNPAIDAIWNLTDQAS